MENKLSFHQYDHPLKNFSAMSNDLILDMQVKPVEKMLFVYMGYRLKNNPRWDFNMVNLMKYCKVKNPHQIHKYIKNLKKERWIEVRRQNDKKNIYRLNHSKNVDSTYKYQKMEEYALLSIQKFIQTVQYKAYGFTLVC